MKIDRRYLPSHILHSEPWLESVATRIVWITLLAEMTMNGVCHFSSVDDLAERARVSHGEAREAVEILEHHLGQIVRRENGWVVIEGRKYHQAEMLQYRYRVHSEYQRQGLGSPHRWCSIRVKILKRDHYLCAYCGNDANSVDHIIPRIQGGTEDEWNLAGCCLPCNGKKNGRTPLQAKMNFEASFDMTPVIQNRAVLEVVR